MQIIIRCDQPLHLAKLRDPLLRVWERCCGQGARQHADAEQRFMSIRKHAERYRACCPSELWEAEETALGQLLAAMPMNRDAPLFPLMVQPLVFPDDLPLSALPLLEGWEVQEQAAELAGSFSPLAMLWLREMGASSVRRMQGKAEHICANDGVAVIAVSPVESHLPDLPESDQIPEVHEFRHHDVEHIDTGMLLLQANVDDCSPEWMAHAMERLLEAGANDVHFIPVTMKKSRPGILVQVLCYRSRLEALKTILFQETTTFGIRYFPAACHRLARQFLTVKTAWGEVPVKMGYHRGTRVQCSPEYAVCARLAKEAGVSVKEVHQEALFLARQQLRAGE